MNNSKRLSISSTHEISNKLDDIKNALKSKSMPYKGRISDALIINSLIEILHQNLEKILNVPSNQEVKRELERVLNKMKTSSKSN